MADMGQVTVKVNNVQYQVGCDDGEEDHVLYLAEFIDNRVQELARAMGQVGDERLLLMASLLIAEDLEEAYSELETVRQEIAALKGGAESDQAGAAPAAGNAGGQRSLSLPPISDDGQVEALARRLDSIAARLESA
jgi:cell division protein ZapA